MTFKEKIDKILRMNRLGINSVAGLEDKIKAGRGAINKYYKKGQEPGEDTIKKILDLEGLNKDWWDTEIGDPFKEGGSNSRAPEEIYRDLVEANSEYRLVPKVILEGKYVIVLEEQIGKTEEALWEALRAKDDYIKDLKEEVAMYRKSSTAAQKT